MWLEFHDLNSDPEYRKAVQEWPVIIVTTGAMILLIVAMVLVGHR